MHSEVKAMVDVCWPWVRDNTAWRFVGKSVEITTPYLDRHNDFLQVYVSQRDGGYVLCDDGTTLGDLRTSGHDLDAPEKRALLDTILNGLGVERTDDGVLRVVATVDNFSSKQHSLLQAMLAIGNLSIFDGG